MGWEQTASGYAAVWANENTRGAIFDAMKRREVYATTGPRMAVRFFGGLDFEATMPVTACRRESGTPRACPWAAICRMRPKASRRLFSSLRCKDPIGANLDRSQIIKGWLDAKGAAAREDLRCRLVLAVASPTRSGKVPSVGSTVDVQNANWTNTIGATELITVWSDPEFDPAQRAFYYARVIEIPTPRWTAYDAKYFGVKMPKEVPMSTTERAYTSPIWYTAGNVSQRTSDEGRGQGRKRKKESRVEDRVRDGSERTGELRRVSESASDC